jgi:MFS family permease
MRPESAPDPDDIDESGRPRAPLPIGHLLRISAYWLGLTAVDFAVNLFIQYRLNFGGFVSDLEVGTATAVIGIGGATLGIVIQPTVGAISDFTVSRWGRRKPYIVIGTLLDVVFLVAIANAQTVLALAVFVLLLSFSTNLARGPFQGYVPDLVPSRQVGMASALVGLMQVLGNVTGAALVPLASTLGSLPLAIFAVGIVELVTMVSVVYRVGNGRPPKPREGRSWLAIARSAWATDILAEHSFLWLLVSRFFFLMGGGILVNLIVAYLKQSHGLIEAEANNASFAVLAVVAASNVVAVIPAARLSDRIGRKPVIYASTAIAGVGTLIVAIAPDIPLMLLGGALFGVGSGMFLAVDWALMTDIIPKASAGRYMGLSNVATGASTPFAVATGGILLDVVNRLAGEIGPGPRAAYLLGVVYFLLAAWLLRRVVEPRRSAGQAEERPESG